MRNVIRLLVVASGAMTYLSGCMPGFIDAGDPAVDPASDPSDRDPRATRPLDEPTEVPAPAPDPDPLPDPTQTPWPAFNNPIGIGLVSPGNPTQWDLTRELTGRGGHIKLVFPGVDRDMQHAPQDWINAVQQAYDRELVPVVRIGPGWGDRNIRSRADAGSNYRQYTALAAAYKAVITELPRDDEWPLVIEVHNEPNLCYEWACLPESAPPHSEAPIGWMHYEDIAAEYASFLRDVTFAIRSLEDARIRVINGALAPGGAMTCECDGPGYSAGITSLPYLSAMETAVPGVHEALDGFASHPYPASGEGWGFFSTYADSAPGLYYYQTELELLGIDKPVFLTETGWRLGAGATDTRDQIAEWTAAAFENDWFSNPEIRAVMPFMLQDPAWNDLGWVDANANPYPVFDAVRNWRCAMEFPDPC